MNRLVIVFFSILILACNTSEPSSEKTVKEPTAIASDTIKVVVEKPLGLTKKQAISLLELPLTCINTEYPNKLGQTIGGKEDIGEPSVLHPAFYGCFDWHSSVHGHWSLVKLLKSFPDIENAADIKTKLLANISKKNIEAEVVYFEGKHNTSYERTYGWAWLLKLAEEINSWDDPVAKELETNLQPLTDLIIQRYIDFLPKLKYPIRVGEHTNTAFGLSFAYDFAVALDHQPLKEAITKRAKEFYTNDTSCPIGWEPSGYDFLSPCLEEVDIMRKILSKSSFDAWVQDFMPQLKNKDFDIPVGEVSDRTDGKLVHLDGLNFSRAWVLYGLANQYPEYEHLINIANKHVNYSLPNLVGDSYEGGHWLGSFAIYALQK